jgi:hypothetical protein
MASTFPTYWDLDMAHLVNALTDLHVGVSAISAELVDRALKAPLPYPDVQVFYHPDTYC